MQTTKKSAAALFVTSVCFAVATSAFQLPRWMGWVAFNVMVLAGVVFAFEISARWIPWEIRRKDPQYASTMAFLLQIALLRNDLLHALDSLFAMNDPVTPAQLRTWADNVSQRLANEGYAVSAKTMEVHLQDDADANAVVKRKGEARDALIRM